MPKATPDATDQTDLETTPETPAAPAPPKTYSANDFTQFSERGKELLDRPEFFQPFQDLSFRYVRSTQPRMPVDYKDLCLAAGIIASILEK